MTNDKKINDELLRAAFKIMDSHRAQEIREAYYNVVEGLRTLADALEIADADKPGPASELLLHEHCLACEAIDVIKQSKLGRIL